MKKKIVISMLVCASVFVACDSNQNAVSEQKVSEATVIETDSEVLEHSDSTELEIAGTVDLELSETVDLEPTDQTKAYAQLLWDAFYLGQIDGKEFEHPNAEGNPCGSFAIYDIDGDGREELLLDWEGSAMATTVEFVWGYDADGIHEEAAFFPSARFWDNGIIEGDWSHNQGLAGDFWPYSVFQYHEQLDVYQEYGSVDAWDKNMTGMDVNYEGELFPSQIDEDGDGIVYYILPVDWDGSYDIDPVDGAGYEKWRADYLQNGQEIKNIPFQDLNENNIAGLGVPKPEYVFPEPLG